MIVIERQKEQAEFIAFVTGGTYSTETGRFIGLEKKGKLVAVCGYTDYNGNSVQMHIALNGRFTYEFLRFCFDYAFNQLNVKRVVTVVDSANKKSLKFSFNCGFQIEHIVKDAGVEEDLYILSMYPFQCKLLNNDIIQRDNGRPCLMH